MKKRSSRNVCILKEKNMMKQRTIAVFALFLAGGCISNRGELHPSLSFRLTGADKSGDSITVLTDDDRTVLDVYSKSGIGRVELSSANGNWPRPIIIRFHLGGLEALDIDNGHIRLDTYKLITLVDKERRGPPATPIGEGYYEVTLPNALFDGNSETIFVQWIDFLRR
jgi:hypothetical protein